MRFLLDKYQFNACDRTCAEAFAEDRKLGAIYGPYINQTTGQFFSNAEAASIGWNQCVYCNKQLREENEQKNRRPDQRLGGHT